MLVLFIEVIFPSAALKLVVETLLLLISADIGLLKEVLPVTLSSFIVAACIEAVFNVAVFLLFNATTLLLNELISVSKLAKLADIDVVAVLKLFIELS